MTHRVFNLKYGVVNVFDTGVAAHTFIAKTPGELKVLCRKRFVYMRSEDGTSIHIILHATRHEDNKRFLDAAHQIAKHIEEEIAKADQCSTPMI